MKLVTLLILFILAGFGFSSADPITQNPVLDVQLVEVASDSIDQATPLNYSEPEKGVVILYPPPKSLEISATYKSYNNTLNGQSTLVVKGGALLYACSKQGLQKSVIGSSLEFS